MHRFITWFNCFKARFKSKRFIIPIIFALTFLFLPNTVFAVGESNTVTTTTQEFYWHGINAGGVEETQRFNSTQNHFYKWGSSTANYQLIRFAPLIHFNSFGVDTSYKARIAFYVVTRYPFNYDSKFCTAWSGNGEKYSCSLHKEMEDQIGSNEFMLTYVYDYEWTSSTNYIEFWLNFDNFITRPNDTEFGYTIIDFQGNVSGNQIILDGLGQTNEKLDQVKDVIKESFEKCSPGTNLFDRATMVEFKNGYRLYTNGSFVANSSFYGLKIPVEPNTTYTSSSNLLDKNLWSDLAFFDKNMNFLGGEEGRSNKTFTTPNNCYYVTFAIYNQFEWFQLQKGSFATSYQPYKVACKNRLDETNDKLDDLNNSLNNDDVSGATNTGNDFFDNFSLDDNGGISSIVTLPLRVIRGLISGENNCSALNFDILGTSVYFPGGCIMWDHVSNANETLFQTIICGFFGYILLIQLFKDIEDLKNPDKEEVKTIDL